MSYSNPIEHLYQEELYNLGSKVLVLIPVPWNTLSEVDQLTLSKMMAALKLSMSSVQVLALEQADTDDLHVYRPHRIIALGSSLKVSGKSIPSYQCFGHGQISVVQADSLDQLDEAKKKNLWKALRDMFQV